jgi:hypothetical protein
MDDAEYLAQEAYKAYGGVTDWKNYQGLPMPKWEDLTPTIQEAWRTACRRVKQLVQNPSDVG